MLINNKVTIYHFTKDNGYIRTGTFDCFLDDTQRATFNKTGQTNSESTFIMIPYTGVNLELTQGKDIIVVGECDYEVDNTNINSQSQSLRVLRETYKSIMLLMIDSKLYGSRNMWHYELSCK